MVKLSELKNTHRKNSGSSKRIGRGLGSKKGKTCGRGTKGAKSRSGYKRRAGKEGGQLPMFKKLPIRGFSRGRFKENTFEINIGMLDKVFDNNDSVNRETLCEKHLISSKKIVKIRVLGNGEITKTLNLEVDGISLSAKEKIEKANGTVKLICR